MKKLEPIVHAIVVIAIMYFFYGLIKISLIAYDFIM